MCGIYCMFSEDESYCIKFYEKHVKQLLENRGPNNAKQLYRNSIYWSATILHHQGQKLTQQPIQQNDIILLFNGDLYMNEIDKKESDSRFLCKLIENIESEEEFLNIFKTIVGPFSLICKFQNSIFIARDSLGRNSLLIGKYYRSIFFTSVIDVQNDSDFFLLELPPLGIYKMNPNSLDLFPYIKLENQYHQEQIKSLEKIIQINVQKKTIDPQWLQVDRNINYKFSFDEIINNNTSLNLFESLLRHPEIDVVCNNLVELLSNSIKYRVERTQNQCKTCLKINENTPCLHANISILFSGGVDCSIISFLANKFIDKRKPIDLLNVAFEKSGNKSDKIDFMVPDRISGLMTFNELKELCPDRRWNFVEINVTRLQVQEHKSKLRSLIYPLDNVLDESLGTALYFASRGQGFLANENNIYYESNSRVIFIGSGADELFGGYTRHRNAFKRSSKGNNLLQNELDYDWVRLPSRNLARDDRVICDHGITVRAPYIEEHFINFVRNLDSLQRCYPAIEEGIGDKLLLRLCAHKLGLTKCCRFRKRALQFGSKIADKRQSANDKSKLLQQN